MVTPAKLNFTLGLSICAAMQADATLCILRQLRSNWVVVGRSGYV